MKKLFLIPALLAGSLVMAKSHDYEVSVIGGQNMTEDSMDLDYHMMFGTEVQVNKYTSVIHPEISIFYSPAEYFTTKTKTDIFRMAINAVYEYEGFKERIIPTAKLGLGYKTISEVEDDTDSAFYTNLVLGAKVPLVEGWSLKAEYAYMVDIADNRYDNNHAFWGGVSYMFNIDSTTKQKEKEQPTVAIFDDYMEDESVLEERVVKPKVSNVVIPTTTLDSDNDGVADYLDKCTRTQPGEDVDEYGCKLDVDYDMDGIKDSIDKCIYTPEGAEVYSNGCQVDNDSDEDGIKDSIDKCMYTPLNAKVYTNGCSIDPDSDGDGIKDSIDECINTPVNTKVRTNGCPITFTNAAPRKRNFTTSSLSKNDEKSIYKKIMGLNIAFKYKSFDVTKKSEKNIKILTKFLNENPSYEVKISGYTDNVGSARYNKKLSLKRANKVKELIAEDGISEDRVHAVGKGEDNPIADNSTSKGRAKNRRIEIILIKR